jgi:hypothetical protein
LKAAERRLERRVVPPVDAGLHLQEVVERGGIRRIGRAVPERDVDAELLDVRDDRTDEQPLG